MAYYRLKLTADGGREPAEARRVREDTQKRLEEQRKPMPEKGCAT